jgi:hypothetical protein
MSTRPRSALTVPLVLAAAFACKSAPEAPPPAALQAQPLRAWTDAFQKEAVLVADEITIEGPSDLLEHVALRQDDESTIYATKTVAAGLLQELAARPELGLEVRAQLDAWSLAAFKKISVLQRPGEVAVTVRARGNAFWSAADGSGEKREAELVFQGVHGQGRHGP